ncbi:MAG: FixH family protein [Deltaproteobacteria bacterium]|jgi:hypothetical protein
MKLGPVLLTLPLVLAAACSGGDDIGTNPNALCGDESRATDYVSGLELDTTDAAFTVRLTDVMVADTPQPPDRGNNLWTFEVLDSAGSPVTDATVEMKAWMPDHGHGTNPLWNDARPMNGGGYEVGAFDLFMGGFWQFTFRVDQAGNTDEGVVGFCIEG